jgi:3-oxoacyl-[acyl-carrier protein] reductase
MLWRTMSQVKNSSPTGAPLEGRVVLITGASSGIGRAIALACARAGADLATTYRSNQAGAEAVAREVRALGRRMEVLRADIARQDEIDQLVAGLKAGFGRVDVWINNAGADILTGEGARLSRLEKLDLLLAVDLRGTMLASWAAVHLMRSQPGGGGVIINMSWDGVMRGLEGENPQLFAAVKGGILGFSKSLARTVAPRIRVNVLGPGWIETAFGAGADSAFKSQVNESVPLRRWGTAEDVAGAAVYLASDASSYVTGQMIMINGGDVM